MVYVDECVRAPATRASACPSISCLTLVAVRPLNVSLGTSLDPQSSFRRSQLELCPFWFSFFLLFASLNTGGSLGIVV